MQCVVFLVVRTDSKRLPNKIMLKINKKPLIQFLIDRINSTDLSKKIIVCTTKRKIDDGLVSYLEKNEIPVFRGKTRDILHRMYDAAQKYDLKHFVVVEGDDIFCEPKFIDETWIELNQKKYDFVFWDKIPLGVSPTGIQTKKLKELIQIKKTNNTETGWIKFIINSNIFKIKKLEPKNNKIKNKKIRLTIDYKEDLQLAKILIKKLPTKFSLLDIIEIFEKNTKLIKINESVKQTYLDNFKNKMIKEKIR